jgi:hypothetical protein
VKNSWNFLAKSVAPYIIASKHAEINDFCSLILMFGLLHNLTF